MKALGHTEAISGGVTMSKKEREAICLICEEKKTKGIYLYHQFLCRDCEQKLISTSTSDPSYADYVRKLKNLHTPPLYS